jgi:hypothetical protein
VIRSTGCNEDPNEILQFTKLSTILRSSSLLKGSSYRSSQLILRCLDTLIPHACQVCRSTFLTPTASSQHLRQSNNTIRDTPCWNTQLFYFFTLTALVHCHSMTSSKVLVRGIWEISLADKFHGSDHWSGCLKLVFLSTLCLNASTLSHRTRSLRCM